MHSSFRRLMAATIAVGNCVLGQMRSAARSALLSAHGRYCCKSILTVRARNIDSSFHSNAQH